VFLYDVQTLAAHSSVPLFAMRKPAEDPASRQTWVICAVTYGCSLSSTIPRINQNP
jgi:hypothetical protein